MRAWAAVSPDSPALIDGDAVLSRAALVAWCTMAARLLGPAPHPEAGDGPALCALLLPRCWAVPLGLIAARMAGLAFLLLDAGQPADRLGGILAQARPHTILARAGTTELQAVLDASGLGPASNAVPIPRPDPGLEAIAALRLTGWRALPDGTGHVVFTSGSSGRPKGVLLRDAPLLRTAAAQRALLGTDGAGPDAAAPSIWALSPGFDASLSDIFCAILGSAPLLVFRGEQTRWRSLAATIARHGAARADLAPALLRLVPPEALGLRAVVFGGERCDPAAAERWGVATLALQAYGPTEAAVCATMALAGPGWIDGQIGRPLPHQHVQLATPSGQYRVLPRMADAGPADGAAAFNATRLLPDPGAEAVTGEIWLGGDAIASGYLDEPGMQAERFGVEAGGRVHRTGDIARWQDGWLVWLGRRDRQVKLHGRLICPEEVEAAAGPAWDGPCACLPAADGLVLALGPPGQAAPAAVLAQVARRLGRAMTPRRAVHVDPWPLLPGGKTDLAALAKRLA